MRNYSYAGEYDTTSLLVGDKKNSAMIRSASFEQNTKMNDDPYDIPIQKTEQKKTEKTSEPKIKEVHQIGDNSSPARARVTELTFVDDE